MPSTVEISDKPLLLTYRKKFYISEEFYKKTSERFRMVVFHNITHNYLGYEDGDIYKTKEEYDQSHLPTIFL